MSDDEQAIRDLVATWFEATRAADLATVQGLMTDDVVFLTPGRPAFGKEAFLAASDAMRGVSIDGTSEIEELQVAGDWAWMRSRLRVVMTPPGGDPIVRSGNVLTILRKSGNGDWAIARDANLLSAES